MAFMVALSALEQRARKELAVFVFVEPRAFDVEELETRDPACEGEGIGRFRRVETMPSRFRTARVLRMTYGSKNVFDCRITGLVTRCINRSSL